ncbi:MAG: type I restriction endonuclease subunit R [Chitinophagales bacterium]|nr:type I restriction endonuclease subunit R [Chitinophagales bacterium]
MKNSITENEIEEIALSYLQKLGYSYIFGTDISPDGEHPERQYTDVVLTTRLREAIDKLNPSITQDAKEDALKKVLRTESPNTLINNETFHKYLTEGVDVEVRTAEGIRGEKVYIVDFDNVENNEFLAINQFTIIEGSQNKRPDIILFINGLPLVVIELKNAVVEKADVEAAFNQIQTYQNTIPSLFTYNAFNIISDGWSAAYGTISSSLKYYKPWKSIDGVSIENTEDLQMEFLLKGLCNKTVLLDTIKNYIVFEKTETKTIKKIAQYHQYYAVKKAIETTIIATKTEGDKRAGVVWHTQGSGKSLSMVFYTGKIVTHPVMQNPTIVVLTDRNDLDDQLFETFTNCNQLLRQFPKQAENRHHLKEILNVVSGGIIFTTIQKFQIERNDDIESNDTNIISEPKVKYIGVKANVISDRHNIVVIADEAHRSQYGLLDGFASRLRESLPNASYIGFTGTPIESTDKSTQAIFGDYIHVYDIQQAVKDGATVPIYYESRVAKIALDDSKKIILDAAIEELTEQEELSNAQRLKARWSSIEAVVGSKERLKKVAFDLVTHFEKKNAIIESKAMVVCMSRQICVDLYNEIIALKPHWHSDDDTKGIIKVIMTGSSADVKEFQPHLRNKTQRKAIGERLKDENDGLKIVLVRDMWLTGFDAPVLNTLYVDKPMQGANLMQAIARVNRVFNNAKEGGLVVDYIGLAQYLKEAMIEYTSSGGQGAPALDDEIAVAKCLELYEGIVHQLRHFDWLKFFKLKPEEKLKYISVIQQYIFSQENGNENFIDVSSKLLKAYALVSTHERVEKIKDHIALFQAIRARLLKFLETGRLERGKRSFSEIDLAIKQIVSDAIVSEDVVDIFDAAGIKKPDISILDERFLEDVQKMEHKNLAVELLKKLLRDEIKKKSSYNLIESKHFSEKLEEAIKRYHNGQIDSVEFIEKWLVPLANEIREAEKRGQDLGLDFREYAFYTALEVNNSAVKILGDEVLKHIAQELLKTVRNNTTIDWTIKESVQSALRRNIRRILRLHGYPPDLQEKAVDTVITQAKMLAEDFIDNKQIDD